jgi:hypothetical protein
VWGAADDASKFASDGGTWFYDQLKGAGLTSNRWTLAWDPSSPNDIKEQGFLERAAPKAQAAGVRVLLALYAGNPAPTATQHDVEGFCAWAGKVADLVKSWGIHDFIVWNEPNTRLYWMPQKDDAGNDIAAPAYEALLARCYDTIHESDEAANVIGMGLSPRASTSASNEPLSFVRNVGKAYKASGRTKPIMDQLSVHPYPNPNSPTDSPDVGYEVQDRFGISNMDRVKQAIWDAFNGTGQPTTLNGLTLVIDEVGWQTDTTGMAGYVNDENVRTVNESTQAAFLKLMARKYFACDPAIVSVQLFLLVDEPYRNGRNETGQVVGGGWQSGLLTAGGESASKPKAAYTQNASDFSAGRSACQGALIDWKPNGGGSSAGGGSAKSTSAFQGDPSGILQPTVLAGLQGWIQRLQATQASFPPFVQSSFASMFASFQTMFNQLLGKLQADGPFKGFGSLVVCGSCGPNDVVNGVFGRSLSNASAANYKTIASANFSAKAGATPKATLKSGLKKGAKAPAGKYFLAFALQSADKSSKYAFAVQVGTVKAAKAKPAKKKK